MAVYTEVDDAELRAFVAAYDIGDVVSAKGIAEGVENSNYLLQTTRGPWILTLYEKRVAPADLPFFMGLMEHCAARGIDCPLPIRDRGGVVIRELAGRPAVIVSFLQGMSPRRVEVGHCEPLGGALAHLHMAVADFPMRRDNALSIAGWRKLVEQSRPRADEVAAFYDRISHPVLADLRLAADGVTLYGQHPRALGQPAIGIEIAEVEQVGHAQAALQPVADQRGGKAAAVHRMDRLVRNDPPGRAFQLPLGQRRADHLGRGAVGHPGPAHASLIEHALPLPAA